MDAIINWSLLVFIVALAALPLFLGLATALIYTTNCAARKLTALATHVGRATARDMATRRQQLGQLAGELFS